MKTRFLLAVSALALAGPAFAADIAIDNNTAVREENTDAKIKEGMKDAREAVQEGYRDIKASLLSEDPNKIEVSEFNVDPRNTASGIIGQPVFNASNERVGKIHDVIIDQNGNAQMVVVADGDFFGMGKLAAFDYGSVVKVNADGDIVAPLTEEVIDQAAQFTYDRNNTDPNVKVIPTNGYSATALLKGDLVNPQKDKIADVDDLVLRNGKASQLIVGFDKVLGLGGQKTALNYKTAAVIKDGDQYDFQLNTPNANQFENYKKSLKQ